MEWTYCLTCGAQQLPGYESCPECAVPQEDTVPSAPAADEVTQVAWSNAVRSIWLAQASAALGGLLFALGCGYCFGYVSRMRARDAPSPPLPAPRADAVEPVAFGLPALLSGAAMPAPGALTAAPSGSSGAPIPAGWMGPPAPEQENEGVSKFWTAPPARSRSRGGSTVPEVLAPPLQLYGSQLPEAPSVWIYWQLETPPEWQGWGVSP